MLEARPPLPATRRPPPSPRACRIRLGLQRVRGRRLPARRGTARVARDGAGRLLDDADAACYTRGRRPARRRAAATTRRSCRRCASSAAGSSCASRGATLRGRADRTGAARSCHCLPMPASAWPVATRPRCSARVTACRTTRDGARAAAARARHGQARRWRAELLVRHRPRLSVRRTRRDGRPATARARRVSSSASAKRVAQLLGTPTDDGFVYRVDLRLRPFGDSGPVAISFDAIEDYLQQHGRDWERYAYVKARPVYGAEPGFDDLYRNVLRPFVYRRYLDFSVFESLRGMKELIAREVERRELQQNVKLGPGGIREIEFIVQAFQLLRGGSTQRAADAQPARGAAAAGRAEAAAGRDRRRTAGGLSLPAARREPPAGVERRADARAARATSMRVRGSRSRWGCPAGLDLERELEHIGVVSARISSAPCLRPAPRRPTTRRARRSSTSSIPSSTMRAGASGSTVLRCAGPGRAVPAAARPAARERLLPAARRDRPTSTAGPAATPAACRGARPECRGRARRACCT